MPATAALRRLFAWAHDGGGFGASVGAAADPATTTWALHAIAAATDVGLAEPRRITALVGWYHAHGERTPLAAACDLSARFTAGQDPKTSARLGELATFLSADVVPDDPQAMFWASLGLFHHGGEPWRLWQQKLTPACVKQQVRDGEQKGSWAPARGRTRLTTSALNVLTLEIYYRYSRLVR